MKEYIYIENVVDILQSLADKEYQINVWLNTNNPNNWVDSFVESANMFFDDCIIGDLLSGGEVIISKDVTQTLQELHDATNAVDEYRSEEEIINDPKMQIVREKAARALELIEASDGSESTVDFVKVGTSDVIISIADAFK